jgi:CRISPR-associated protein Cas5d
LNKTYSIALEISGPTAMWTRPDSGDCPVSYPVPTYSAVKGIFESILWGQMVEVVPVKVEICAPIIYHNYNTNYGGPLRKGSVVSSGGGYQLYASVLLNPCYRLYAEIERNRTSKHKISAKAREWDGKTTCPEHAYQAIFNRRLSRGQCFSIPFLGWKEFAPDYVGPFRDSTRLVQDVNLRIPSMLRQVFPDGIHSDLNYIYDTDVAIENGALIFDKKDSKESVDAK